MKKPKTHSMYRILIIRIIVFLVIPFFAVTLLTVFRIVDEGLNSWQARINLETEQGKSIRAMHVQNVYALANRICTDNGLSGFLLVNYTNQNLQYYRTQIASILSSDHAKQYGYTVRIFYANPTIPRGFGSFFFLSDLDTGKTADFIDSPETDHWILPCDTEGYIGNFTPYEKHYTYLRKVLINNELLYVLAISVPEKEMDSFLHGNQEKPERPIEDLWEITQTGKELIINYDASLHFSGLSQQEAEQMLQTAQEKGSLIKRIDINGFPQSLLYIYPQNPQYGALLIIAATSAIFAIVLVLTVVRFIKKISRSMYVCLEQFDASIANGFHDKLPLKGDDEITRMARAFNEQIDKIQELLTLTINQACLVKESRLKALQQQINPHFLYNTLEAFSYKMELYGHYEEADAMVAFSNMLRYNMTGKERFSSLDMELKQTLNYMCIQQLKFSNISLTVTIPSELYGLQVPRFLLQPIIENCFVHGYYGEPLHIILNAESKEDYVYFEITDNGKGIPDTELKDINEKLSGTEDRNESGIGLSNINSRLCLFYSVKCRLHVRSQEWNGTTVTWRIPRKSFPAEGKKEMP